MSLSNRDRVGKALELLNQGLQPFVVREMEAKYGQRWRYEALNSLREQHITKDGTDLHLDTQALLLILWDQWQPLFRTVLGQAERSLVSELRNVRNAWAHQEPFSLDDAYRALDSAQRLLSAVSASVEADEIEKQRMELLRQRFEEQARNKTRKNSGPLRANNGSGLPAWREIVIPQQDVASGSYQIAEFAADLGRVHKGEGANEYRVPRDFFQRTYLTYGLRQLLSDALLRLSGKGGNPIVDLQTNFGGGKTHSLLALYHLFSGAPVSDLGSGLEQVLKEVGLTAPPQARRAVLVGYELSPGKAVMKEDGCAVHTLWGELAWQLLGREGYALVADADRQGVSPGSDTLIELFRKAGPSLILIDEWVVFARQLYAVSGLPAGSFDANLSFAQSLTQAAMATPHTLVVATIPSSDGETGGEGGREAATRLKNIFGRVETPWRPADAEEGFEIVRRRIFQPITDPVLFTERDAVAKSFANFYQSQPQEFPTACRDAAYEKRIRDAYPIHPELFDRLYSDWSSLEKFQRTRGVLRLMATVVHTLWQRNDTSPLILPSSVPIDERAVQNELTRYLEDNWVPIIEKDVDGPNSLPRRIDGDNSATIGRFFACTRVARTIYLGSAPLTRSANRGLTEQQIKLGCAMPKESVATFGDALRRLSEQAHHLNLDGQHFWYSTQPTVTRLANDKASQYPDDDLFLEIERRLKDKEAKTRGDFARVHVCPPSSAEVIDDDTSARLVILKPEYTHGLRDDESKAAQIAREILDNRGNQRRNYRNAIVFLAADRNRLEDLKQGVRQFLAWQAICDESDTLNLDAFQSKQALSQRKSADEAVDARISETYTWLLAPEQTDAHQPASSTELAEVRLQPQGVLAPNASRKLYGDGKLVTQYVGTLLRIPLDTIPLWQNHVALKDLTEYFAKYPYLPRLKNTDVLLKAIENGLNDPNWQRETFAYADGYDAERQRYLNLRPRPNESQHLTPILNSSSLLVKPEIALAQFAAEEAERLAAQARAAAATVNTANYLIPNPSPSTVADPPASIAGAFVSSQEENAPAPISIERPKTRFHGSVSLDPRQTVKPVQTIAAEVLQHLTSLYGCKVEVTFEIHADFPEGFPEEIQRIIKENCATLKFGKETDFEEM